MIIRRVVPLVTALTVVAVAIPGTTALATSPSRGAQPAVPGSRYLALGDSVAFGYREAANPPTPDYTKPASFRGYPEEVAAALGLRLTNAACPGETTSSFLNPAAPSNGCENRYDTSTQSQQAGGYRTLYPLHVRYTGSQFAFAKHFLATHPATRLVTMTIGANDGYLCLSSTTDSCVGEFGQLLSTLRANLGRTFKGLRGTGYTGQIVLLNYYSPNYADSILTGEVMALNQALAQVAAPYHVKVASGFDAFSAAAAQTGGDTCAAALVTVLTSGGCGVHPSVSGTALLAQAVQRKVRTI